VYAHSSNTLYRLNPETLEVQVVGSFSGCSSVIDIALDKDSNIYATTFSGLYEIDSQTAACRLAAGFGFAWRRAGFAWRRALVRLAAGWFAWRRAGSPGGGLFIVFGAGVFFRG
jgi:hypothetical protein